MFRTKIFSTLMFAAAFLSLGAFSGALAQGRYTNQYSRNDVNNIIQRLEESSNQFRTDFRDQMNRNRINGTSDEGRFNGIVADYENSLDRLRRRFDRGDNWWQSRNEVQNVMNNARPVNDMMNSVQFRRNLERQWNQMRNDINKLADTFDLPGLNGGGWNGGNGGWNGGNGGWNGQMTNPPNWATGTFYSTNGRDNIVMTIAPNGAITLVNNGQSYYGGYNRGTITVNNDTSDLRQTRNGIQTYNRSTRETTNYSRNSGGWNGGGYPGGYPGGNVSTPPSWAQGTFYSTRGEQISMAIGNDGRITLYTNGQTYYGTYYQNTINLNGDTSTVSQTRNGIRTYNQRTGETTDYRRR